MIENSFETAKVNRVLKEFLDLVHFFIYVKKHLYIKMRSVCRFTDSSRIAYVVTKKLRKNYFIVVVEEPSKKSISLQTSG